MTVRLQGSRKTAIKKFFKETFRPHSKEEYAEVFTRGIVDKEGVNGTYPWLYLRAFVLLFALFALTSLVYRVASYSVIYMTAMIIGGLTFNIPLLILFYEVYPKKDTSLINLLFIVLVGGAVCSAIILLGYEFIYDGHDNPWISYIWTGFWEELIKMLVAIPAVLLLKKKDPFTCFLIGFAVGSGYSMFEDLGYILSYSQGYTTRYTWLVLMTVGRGLSCICSHAPWTAVICWAFAKFKKPFINFRFYGVVFLSMLLHYLADVPFYADEVAFLTGINWGWAIEIFVVAAILAEMFLMLKNSFKEFGIVARSECAAIQSQKANVVAVAGVFILSICALLGTALPIRYQNKSVVFDNSQELKAYIQNGNTNIAANWDREYDAEKENYSSFTEDGELKIAAQRETEGELIFYYVYEMTEEKFELKSIGLKREGEPIAYCRRMVIYEDHYFVNYGYPPTYEPITDIIEIEIEDDIQPPEDETGDVEIVLPVPKEVVSYFPINTEAERVSYSDGKFTVSIKETYLNCLGGLVAVSTVAGATLIGCAAAIITLKIKSRGKNNG